MIDTNNYFSQEKLSKLEPLPKTDIREYRKQKLFRRISLEKLPKVKYLLEKYFKGYPYDDSLVSS